MAVACAVVLVMSLGAGAAAETADDRLAAPQQVQDSLAQLPAFPAEDFDAAHVLSDGEEVFEAVAVCCDEPDHGTTQGACPQRCRPWFTWRDRLTVGAEYVLLRPTFSNATALYQTTTSAGPQAAQTALNFDFGYSSGVRGFIGYRLDDDWMARFSYLGIFGSAAVSGTSSGNWQGGNGTGFVGPFNTSAVVAGQSIRSTSGVNLNVYDLELAGRLNPSACGPAAGGSRWDSAAAVGLRIADSSVTTHVYNDRQALGQADNFFVNTSRTFQGVGPRLAIQGRRYLGARGRWSVFAAGGGSLLVGTVSNEDTRLRDGDISSNLQTQRDGGPLVVPNLDLSLGATWQIAERTSLSAGWMLMYWGQVGYAERISTTPSSTTLPDLVPLTNSSLTYDGAFFRLTHNF
ncbi:MAG: hypothetical protein EBS56_08950 [Planctomycetia bacterium]|nr:hypothetical protein [Planctomycetia bacterium]